MRRPGTGRHQEEVTALTSNEEGENAVKKQSSKSSVRDVSCRDKNVLIDPCQGTMKTLGSYNSSRLRRDFRCHLVHCSKRKLKPKEVK